MGTPVVKRQYLADACRTADLGDNSDEEVGPYLASALGCGQIKIEFGVASKRGSPEDWAAERRR
ncbi:hypothetical protein SPFM20_00004 [Salmonella phage SPFM20]|nr:hypothetical protein SPFM8_00001 [Salmonella phage SPFM8]VFR14498.1 hypothetical protein SPFM20_00004 [Salmonella phage SPFM20]